MRSFDLDRFTSAQEQIYQEVLSEIKSGRKQSHWMWYVFPQISGLGHSDTAKHYAIKNVEEAQEYMRHPVLGKRLLECTEAVLAIEGRTASEIFGSPDDLKLRSSMRSSQLFQKRTLYFTVYWTNITGESRTTGRCICYRS